MKLKYTLPLALVIFLLSCPAFAQEEKGTEGAEATQAETDGTQDEADNESDEDESADAASNSSDEIKVETEIEGLTNPFGIAIQPETGHVFIADSGAMRVVRVVDKKLEAVITDFQPSTFGATVTLEVGPMGLAFLDKNTLAVAGGRDEKGNPVFSLFKIPETGKDAIKADAAAKVVGYAAADEANPDSGIAYSLLSTDEGIYATGTIAPGKGWLLQADRIDKGAEKEITEFKGLAATKELTGVGSPMALTRSVEAGYFAVGEIGSLNQAGDSLLAFYDEQGELLGKFETGLNDITGLAYGPKRGRLFAVDYSVVAPENGGLYKLVADGDDKCKGIKLSSLVKPTAAMFDAKGDLYITVRGEAADASSPSGQLLKISGLDAAPKK